MKQPKLERILIVPDTHVPYEDRRAVRLVLDVAKDFQPHHLIFLGDFWDFYSVSSHSKDPGRANDLEQEIEYGRKLVATIKGVAGNPKTTFIAGNHEDRLTRYLMDKAPALYNINSLPKVLGLKELGVDFVPYKEAFQLGKILYTHDAGYAGANAHRQSFSAFQHSVVIGHTHRLAYEIHGSALGESHLAAMFGWLGDAGQVDYMHRIKIKRDWSHGFGLGYLNPQNGYTYLQPIPIVHYSAVVHGKLYKS
jgi:predicted phosphodiesterase